MGDPNSSVPPNYDPYDSPINYDYIALMNDGNPTLANLSSSTTNDPAASFNPFADPIIPDQSVPSNLIFNNDSTTWGQNQNYNINTATHQQSSQEPGPSRTFAPGGSGGGREQAESSQQRTFLQTESSQPQRTFFQAESSQQQQQRTFLDDTRPLPVWPPEAMPFQCSCCQVLREIIHTDVAGNCATKLEIHGRLGIICHAVLEIKDRVNLVPLPSQFHMIDFCKKSIDSVKEYLQKYCDDQRRAGLVMVQDPLSTFYEALCVGIQLQQNVNNEQPVFSGEIIRPGQPEGERAARRNLAQQRERAGRLTLRDFENYFHLPIEEAARRMNLCPTVVKKICRRDGMNRWPHRKIKSLRRQISNLRSVLSSNDAAEIARAEAEIHRLEQEIANICSGAGGGNN